ncbi:hypothetical protein R3W88_032017 [Solanum pinnatisectum]|uniref:Uncharacterized protein n=1 Tax=Solanum pinnatisectum TaxID=50273 RepID=A0AAV9LRK8_9SOLN|nr:hypothetical protein R3W88_032017 [Solanum pinnatisectum]
MPNTRSKGASLIPNDPELRKMIRKMVNAHELDAQRQRMRQDVETLARRSQNNANDPNIVYKENEGVEEIAPPHHQPLAPRGRVQQPTRVEFEENDLELNGSRATGAIVLPVLPPSMKFTITNTMIQVLNLKVMFRGIASEDANQNFMNFIAFYKSTEISGVS